MTTRNKAFVADLKQFRDLTVQQMERVAINAVQDVLEGAQSTAKGISKGGTLVKGRIPVASGDLVKSLHSEIKGGSSSKGEASYTLTLANYTLGDLMRFEWQQAYALRMELGFKSFPGWHFVGFNAARWDDLVAKYAKAFAVKK